MATKIMLLGQVLHREVLKPRVLNVRVMQQVFDKQLNMFFPESKDYKVVEQEVKVNSGDIVRIEKLEEKLTVEVEHKVVEVVFPIGRTVDPITGRRCRGLHFIDEKTRQKESDRIAQANVPKNYSL
ncbi:28S ribosomal protein s17, mitochondrial [Plakobranchus ocellatus]|uniref:28S ribosomal protein s17, mitochondrial n=1 Tax=Plakobranchus ocellatus TaxID=259542 RepID=A0AAV4DHR2_9GAST|nr:28S ribosomal protein s17, mitochondrial [Plakobranchus ocellatus]